MNKKQSPTPSHSELPTNSLLDKYEVERISRELEFYIKTAGGGHRIGPESEKIGGKGKRESKKTKGSWLRGDGVVCGSIDDVVVVERGGRWRPENHVPVVEVGSCWPRRNHIFKLWRTPSCEEPLRKVYALILRNYETSLVPKSGIGLDDQT
ncbi:hypothetical protein LguiA_013764 [Lonicera macranthoides]